MEKDLRLVKSVIEDLTITDHMLEGLTLEDIRTSISDFMADSEISAEWLISTGYIKVYPNDYGDPRIYSVNKDKL